MKEDRKNITEQPNAGTPPIRFRAEPIPMPNTGLDLTNNLADLLSKDSVLGKDVNTVEIDKFSTVIMDRDSLFAAYDEMAQDTLISSALELYADDCTEYNSDRDIIWCTSDNPDITNMVNYLLTTLNIDKDAWSHIYSMVKYGEVYLQTFRKSDEKNVADVLKKDGIASSQKSMNEELVVTVYDRARDKLVDYVEQIDNPAELMDLRQNGKCVGYVRQKGVGKTVASKGVSAMVYKWNWRSPDIDLYDPTKFVHIYLPNPSDRFPEQVQFFNTKGDKAKLQDITTYKVVKGKSILYDLVRTYRELSLLEDSLLLNRLVRSAILRIIQVEVGDMPTNTARTTLQKVKSKIEQSMSMQVGSAISEYNAGKPIENCIYTNTRNGLGGISFQTMGGDVNVKDIEDVNYYLNKLFSGIKIPKEFLNYDSESSNMDPGTSLTKISGRYAKTIKRIQNAYCQGIKTLINIFLIDKGMINYVNNFEIKMVEPTTLDSNDRAESISTNAGVIETIMSTLSDLPNEQDKLEILLGLVRTYLDIPAVNDVITRIIQEMKQGGGITEEETEEETDLPIEDVGEMPDTAPTPGVPVSAGTEETPQPSPQPEEPQEPEEQLPSPQDLGTDLEEM